MRIVMGVPFLYPALSYGGAARAVYRLAEAMHELGHQVTVLTTDVWDAESRYRDTGSEPLFEVVRVPNLSNAAAYHLQFYVPMGIVKVAARHLADADILHLHTFRNLLNDLLARGAERQGIPFVLSGHGTIPRIERHLWIKKMYDALIGNWQLEHAAGFVAVSEAERRRLRRFGLKGRKVRVIANGIEEREFPEQFGAFRQQWGLAPDEKMILFLGKITPRKGLQHLVRAFAKIRTLGRLVIAGNDMGYADRVKQLIAEMGLGDRVIWTGLVDDDRKWEALADADVTVYPSRNEVFGLVALESLSAGTPVIVCDDDGCAEVIRRTGGGRVVPWGDSGALADAVRRQLLEGKDEETLQVAAERIRVLFNWRLAARRTLRFYSEVLELVKGRV